MAKQDQKTERGRDAKTGEFIPVDEARKKSDRTTVEQVENTGGKRNDERGTDGKFKKNR